MQGQSTQLCSISLSEVNNLSFQAHCICQRQFVPRSPSPYIIISPIFSTLYPLQQAILLCTSLTLSQLTLSVYYYILTNRVVVLGRNSRTMTAALMASVGYRHLYQQGLLYHRIKAIKTDSTCHVCLKISWQHDSNGVAELPVYH